MPLLLQTPPPAVVAPAPPTPAEAQSALLEAFDWGKPLPPAPRLKGAAALDYRWLRAAATFDPVKGRPANPYAGGPARDEAEALRRLLGTPAEGLPAALRALPMKQPGTALALWRWGRLQVRSGAFPPALRIAFEDRLLTAGPDLTRGYALRHGLCWALADKDEARLTALRPRQASDTTTTQSAFQQLFSFLGGPAPEVRLWSLPGLAYRDLHLDQLGGSRVWICPAEASGLQAVPSGTAWIIPSESGALDEREAALSPLLREEGQILSNRLESAGRTAWFAPSRPAFERLGLAWFPILLELDAQGRLASIRMGDAAPARP